MVFWLQGFNLLCLKQANYQRRRRFPISFFFFQPVFFRAESKQASKQATRGHCMKKGEFPATLMFQAAFLCPFLYPLLVVCSGISGLGVRQSHCLCQELGFSLASPPLAHNEILQLMVYLTFCRGLQGKVTPTLAWAIWQHLNGAEVMVIDVKAACAMKEPPLNAAVTTQGIN